MKYLRDRVIEHICYIWILHNTQCTYYMAKSISTFLPLWFGMHLTVAVLSGNANETRYNLQSDYLQQTQIMPFTTIFKGDNNIHCILKNYNCLHLSSSYLSSTMLTKHLIDVHWLIEDVLHNHDFLCD